MVRARPGAARSSRPPQPGVHRGHGRDLPAAAGPHPGRPRVPAERPGQPSHPPEGPGGGPQPVRVAAVTSGPRPARVVVVGGGLAGLSAAVEAADRGATVTLLERRPRLGGATWSFERNGIWFDNGQHVFMRCCTAYRAFLERIGSAGGASMQSRLDVVVMAPGGPVGSIRRTPGPAPLHLAPALLSYPHLSLRQRLAVLRAGLALRRLDPDDPALDDVTFGDWLAARGQDTTAIETFWDLIVLPTVNAGAADASLKLAAKVFVTGLLTEAGAADIGWARAPLSALHGDAARRALEAAGGEVRARVPVKSVRTGPAGLEVQTDEQVVEADSVVVAVPHDAVAELLPSGTVAAQDRLVELGASPIVNVHLVYDRPVTDLDFFATVGSDAQYVFDRTAGAGLDDGRQCLAVSLSAAESYIGMASADLVSHFTAEIARLLPAASEATVTESIVTRENTATFLGAPGTDSLRAGAESGLPGVYLAGAWTDTGWPATMEGAVRSGIGAGRLAARFASRCAGGEAPGSAGRYSGLRPGAVRE
ncbi:MAG: FAD-dependent oxidoreductase [Acidimicrobiaceae bacterium]|nr:FAD-dependent oxidoreductase [Acidimicrobiaceae bacterium]